MNESKINNSNLKVIDIFSKINSCEFVPSKYSNYLKCDFHIHTNKDPKDTFIKYSPYDIIDRAKKFGYDVIAITHHNSVYINKDLDKYAKKKKILLIHGVELTVEKRHVLILNLKKLPNITKFSELSKCPKTSLVIVAHPFYSIQEIFNNKIKKNLNFFEGLEYCSFYPFFFNLLNRKAIKYSKLNDMFMIADSDSHYMFQFGTNFTLVNSKKDINSIITAIRLKKSVIVSRPMNIDKFVILFIFFMFGKFKNAIKYIFLGQTQLKNRNIFK